MKKLLVKIAIFCILFGASLPLIVLLFPLSEDNYILAIIDKNRILGNAQSPRIILAGGSNLAFGINSEAVQNAFHIPVVNMGVAAGFGLGRILDDVSPFLRDGDILLVAAEYPHFTSLWNGNSGAYELIFDARQYRLLLSSRYGLPSGFGQYLSIHLMTAIRWLVPSSQGGMTRSGFNGYGDYIKHLSEKNPPVNNIPPAEDIGPINISYLNYFFQFVDDFTARGITVALSYPSYEEQSWHNSAAHIQELDKLLRSKENLRVISRPEDYYFPSSLMQEGSTNHTNAEGRKLRTGRLIADLRASGILGK